MAVDGILAAKCDFGGKGITLPLVHPIVFPFYWIFASTPAALACQVVARRVEWYKAQESAFAKATVRQSALSTYDASEDWRQGDSNP
jgi:hypothetical protein